MKPDLEKKCYQGKTGKKFYFCYQEHWHDSPYCCENHRTREYQPGN